MTAYTTTTKSGDSAGLVVDKNGRLVIIGSRDNSNLPGIEINFGLSEKTPYLSIIKLDAIGDEDTDGLLNYEEFEEKTKPK